MVSIGLLLIGGYFLVTHYLQTITNYPPREGPIVAFGDSLIAGTGSTAGADVVSNISTLIGEPVINMGVAGDTTARGLERIDTVLKKQPRIVLLLLGGNDYLQRVPKEKTFTNLRTIITLLQKDGAVVVLLGVRGGLLSDNFKEPFETLAKETGSLYVPDVLDGILGNKKLLSDEVHPNDLGYRIMATRIADAIERVVR